jgi:colicin import membrane protein
MSRPSERLSRPSDRWISIALSVLLHGALLAALVYGWLMFRRPPRPAQLAIEARVVDARAVPGQPTPAQQPPTPPPQPPAPPPQSETPPEPVGPPEPTPDELAQRERQRQQAEQAEQAAAEQRAEEEKAAQEKAAQEKAAQEKAAKEAAERQAQERAQRLADAEQKRDAEEDLKRSLAEEQADSARAGPALADWQAMIAAKITRAWLRPPTARPGIECMLYVTQVPGGEVTQVRIGECNGDQAVRQSIEAAVYRASPLPPPPDPALFDRNLKIDFKPD